LLAAAGAWLVLAPTVLAPYPLIVWCHMLVFAMACMALNLLLGMAGSLSLGHAVYFGGAAYAGMFLCRFGGVRSFELYLATAVAAGAVLGAVLGLLSIRAWKIHFAILTLGFSMLVYSVFIDGAIFRLAGPEAWELYLENGPSMYLPRLRILGVHYAAPDFIPVFYRAIALAFVAMLAALWRIATSPFGLALRAIRDNAERAAFVGIRVQRYRWAALTLSGMFMGLAGGLYGQLDRQITLDQLDWTFSVQLVVATVLGGTRRFLGPVAGAFAFVGLKEFAGRWPFGYHFVLGALLVTITIAAPQGIVGTLAEWGARARRGFEAWSGKRA
jgi:branched-chain amino acid transport system permease protein